MIIILGLVILLAAVIVGLAGIFTNSGSTHALTHDLSSPRIPRVVRRCRQLSAQFWLEAARS